MSGRTLVEVLVEHEYALQLGRGAICICGFVPTIERGALLTQQDYHRTHLADAVTAWIGERLTGADGIDAAREQIEAYESAFAHLDDTTSDGYARAAIGGLREVLGIQATHEHEWFDAPRRLCDTRAAAGEMCRCGARREVSDDNAGGRA